MNPDRLVSTREAAEYLGIRLGTLHNWVSARRIEYVRIGRLTRFRIRTLERFIEERTVQRANE